MFIIIVVDCYIIGGRGSTVVPLEPSFVPRYLDQVCVQKIPSISLSLNIYIEEKIIIV